MFSKKFLDAIKDFKPTEKQILEMQLKRLQSELEFLKKQEVAWIAWSTENQKRHRDDREYGTTDVYSSMRNVKQKIKEIEDKISLLG